MHIQPAFTQERTLYSAEFKAEVITALLFNIAVTADVSSRYGVPPSHVRRWLRQIIVQLSEVFKNAEKPFPRAEETRPYPACRLTDELVRLEPGELHDLLASFEDSSG